MRVEPPVMRVEELVMRVERSDQRVLRSDLARIAELAGREQVGSRALLIAGAVAA